MSATSHTNWFWSDWLGDPAVRRLTAAERGVWIDLLAIAAASNPVGYVCDAKGNPVSEAEIARVTNAGSVEEVRKLLAGILEKGAASRDRAGRLFNRRMVREAELRAKRSRAGKAGALHTNLITKDVFEVTRQMTRQMPRQNKTEMPRPFLKENKKDLSSLPSTEPRARDGNSVSSGDNPENMAKPGETLLGDARERATALPTGAPALSRPHEDVANEPAPAVQAASKRPSDVRAAELLKMYAAKRAKKGIAAMRDEDGTP